MIGLLPYILFISAYYIMLTKANKAHHAKLSLMFTVMLIIMFFMLKYINSWLKNDRNKKS